jgi:hypothetical protein
VRLNVWTAIAVIVVGLVVFAVLGRRHPGPDTDLELPPGTNGDSPQVSHSAEGDTPEVAGEAESGDDDDPRPPEFEPS